MYLYHAVPKNMQGDILYPLNQLKATLPEVYAEAVKKYEGREALLDAKVPLLDCLWNDVLHLTPIHPAEVKQALIDAGRSPDFELKYFQVDPRTLDPEKTVIYLYQKEGGPDSIGDDEFVPYDMTILEKISAFPEETKKYYREMIGSGKRPLLYHRIPHILYKGSIDTSHLPVISV